MSPAVAGKIRMPKPQQDVIQLAGGLDQVTPRLELGPGAARRMVNYECGINGGYTRTKGYERYDGRLSPSSVTFKLLPIPTFLGFATVGAPLEGMTSGSTATIIAVGANYVAIANVSGTGFLEGEITTSGGNVVGAIGPQVVTLAKTLRKQYVNLAADVFRAFIQAVPGSGPVRGVVGAVLQGIYGVYAFRDTADGTAGAIYKSTPTGWVNVPLYRTINFVNAGPVPFDEGTLFPLQPVGAFPPATLKRVVLQSGSYPAGTAAGVLIFDAVVNAGALQSIFGPYTIGATTFGTVLSSVTLSILPGGKYEFDYGNFFGQKITARLYGCDGVNPCFEFDGDVYAPLATGTTPIDNPSHIKIHQEHLFVSIGSDVIHSGIGTPYNWTALAGAGDDATGDFVTGFMLLPGSQTSGAMAVYNRNQTHILYGTAESGPSPFTLVGFGSDTGAIPFSIQSLDKIYVLDDRGVTNLQTTQFFGNFISATITRHIQPFMERKRGRCAYSTVHRGKGQYRLFFNDGSGLYITLDNGKVKGCGPMMFAHNFTCCWSGEDSNGLEHTYAGDRNGMVYELDKGTSFDGEAIDAELLLNWNTMKTPRIRKTLKKTSIELGEDTDYVELRVGARLGPKMSAHLQGAAETSVMPTELDMQWDHFTWDDFFWDSHAASPLEVGVKGTSERVQFIIGSSTDYLDSYTMTAILTRFFQRRGVR